MAKTAKAARPVGRPRGGDGDETRRHIISAARSCYATYGYAATTNRMIADAAGLTSAAIYHHFGQKHELMLAVHEATEQAYVARIQEAIETVDGFTARAEALLRVIHAVVVEDPEQIAFATIARDEAGRHEELAPIKQDRAYARLFEDLTDYGVETGEVRKADRDEVQGALAALATGLAVLGATVSPDRHAIATEGACRLVGARLLGG
ncbi:MAG: TetR/AcrR family transcriptional regulator [Acidimicrobiales bacterium]